MSRNPENAALWADADVYVADSLDAANPTDADTPFGAEWSMAGLLDGGAGFATDRNVNQTDHYAWGGILVRTSRREFKLTRKFTVLEDNPTTRRLIWPGSSETEIVVPRPTPIKIAFELREGDKVRRLITRLYAEVDVDGTITEGEADLTKTPLVATIFPDGDGVLFDRQESGTVEGMGAQSTTGSLALDA